MFIPSQYLHGNLIISHIKAYETFQLWPNLIPGNYADYGDNNLLEIGYSDHFLGRRRFLALQTSLSGLNVFYVIRKIYY